MQPRRVRESRLLWFGCGCPLSREDAGGSGCGGNSDTGHIVCGSHACRGAWVRAATAFGGLRSDSEFWRQLRSSHANARIKIYANRDVGSV